MHEILILNRPTANGKSMQKKNTHFNTKFSVLNLYIIRLEYLDEHAIRSERKHSKHTRVGLFLSIYLNSIPSHLIIAVFMRTDISPSHAILSFRGYWSFLYLVWPFTVLISFRVTDPEKIFKLHTGFVSPNCLYQGDSPKFMVSLKLSLFLKADTTHT